jgi:hypothetical protein
MTWANPIAERTEWMRWRKPHGQVTPLRPRLIRYHVWQSGQVLTAMDMNRGLFLARRLEGAP